MKKLPLFFFFAMLIVACNEKNDAINESFYGILPCADCPGIEYELHLNDDNTFKENQKYLESDVDTFSSDGTYRLENDSIVVLEREVKEGITRLVLRDDQLIILGADGKEVEGSLAEYYILSKEKPESTIEEVDYDDAIEYSFKAIGTEPFWNVRFGLDDIIYIHGIWGEGEVIYKFPMPEAKELNEHAKSYRIENDELEMELLVSPEPCNDGMSDNSYTHKVNLHLKLAEWDEFQDLKGCGNYEGIYQLNNIWILESINGDTISENNRNAHLQFNISEGLFYGNGGCNNINGSIEHTETTISFSKIATTLMACENLDEESKFLAKLEGSTYNIKLSKDDLTLENDHNELVFKRLE